MKAELLKKSLIPIFTYGIGLTTLNLPFNLGMNYERIMNSSYLSINYYFNLK